jgi:hypothetical protein
VYGMGMWMVWKGTSCMEWKCGWSREVPRVRVGFVISSCSNQPRTSCGTCNHVYRCVLQAGKGIRGYRMRASDNRQGESFHGREG